MTKKMLRRIAAVILAAIIVAGTMLTAFAESSQYVPYESYTYWDDISGAGRKLVYNRPMFEVDKVLDAEAIGVEKFYELVDVSVDPNGNIFLLDPGSTELEPQIIMLNPDYSFAKRWTAIYKLTDEDKAAYEAWQTSSAAPANEVAEEAPEEGDASAEGDAPEGEEPAEEEENEEQEPAEPVFGTPLDFKGARNIYAHDGQSIYLCDTEHARVIQFDYNGHYIDEYTLPDSPLIPENFKYRPVKVVADSRDYVYILSEGSYYGALLYAPASSGTAKEFIGFYGANTVTNNILDAITAVLKRMFPNNDKAAASTRALPFAFSDIEVDGRDFIYTATDSTNKGQIKKLNPGAGNNILDSDDVRFIDDDVNRTLQNGNAYYQKITGLAVDERDFIFALDSAYGRIFVYDEECRMLTAFGGGITIGTQDGNFMNASAIDLKGDSVLVTDKTGKTLTVFNRNAYGEQVLKLVKMTNDGDYVESRKGWEEVLKLDRNLQVAYTGLARAYLAEGKYEEAMDMALEGYDRDTYALAYEYHRQNLLSEYFSWLFAGVILIAAAIAAVVIIRKRKRKLAGITDDDIIASKDNEAKLALSVLLHPGGAFEEIKEKKRGSIRVSLVILLIFYVTAVLQVLWGGFLFTNYDPGTFNSLWVFVQSAGLVVLWVVANWLVTTLMQGKGKAKEIFVVTCYSLMPMIIERVLYIILTNFLLPTEASFLGIMTTAAMIYTGLLLVIGLMRIHDYSFGRLLGTTVLTVCGMAAIIFLLILVGILLQQLGGFLSTILIELLM